MELNELRERRLMQSYMEEREGQIPAPAKHPCEGISIEEVLRYVTYLMDSISKKDAQNQTIIWKSFIFVFKNDL